MKSYKVSVDINAPAEAVLGVVTTPEYVNEEAKIDGAISCEARIEKSDGGKAVLVSDRVEYSRGPNGKVSKSSKEKNTLTSEWDLGAMKSKWNVKVKGMEKLVQVNGSTWIEKTGESTCRFCDSGTANIKVPLLGAKVEKEIVKDIENNFSKKKPLIEGMIKN
ncbi:MAG TPA: DUF2505 family protein [bacterium]|nr:DUF2505 family protein [bacterium]